MEENPYRAQCRSEKSPPPSAKKKKLLAAFCIMVAVFRMLLWLIGTLRMIAVPERLESPLAVTIVIVWPAIAVVDWAATGMALWRNHGLIAIAGLVIGLCDLIALSLIPLPIEM